MKKCSSRLIPVGLFVLVWLLVMIVLFILPITSKFGNTLENSIIVLIFVFIVSITGAVWYQKTPRIIAIKRTDKLISMKKVKFIISASVIFSCMGLILVLWDRIVVRGIDYSAGLRAARYQWLNAGNIGSIWGKIGNLGVPFSYCALFIGIFHWEKLSSLRRLIAVGIGVGTQVCFAMINGGRSNILMAIVFALSVCTIRNTQGKRFIPKIRALPILIVPVVVLLLIYVSSVFYAFAENDISYLELVSNNLGANLSGWYHTMSNPLVNTIIMVAIYLFHGVYYTGAVLNNLSGMASINQNMSFRTLFVYMSRLKLIDYNMELPSFDGGMGNFMALPGILLYDYGCIGFVFGSVFLGLLFGECLKCINRREKNIRIIELIFSCSVLMVLYMSPVDIATGFSYFIFMVFAMLMMELISGYLYGFSGWTKLNDGGKDETRN